MKWKEHHKFTPQFWGSKYTSQEVSDRGWQKKHAVRISQNSAHLQLATLLEGKLCRKNISRAIHYQMTHVPFPVVTKWINIMAKIIHGKQHILSSEGKFNSRAGKIWQDSLSLQSMFAIAYNKVWLERWQPITSKWPRLYQATHYYRASSALLAYITSPAAWCNTLITLLPAFGPWAFATVLRATSGRCTWTTTKFPWISQYTQISVQWRN